MSKKDNSFWGRLLWSLHADYHRDDATPDPFYFRLWEELSDVERDRFVFIGEALSRIATNVEGKDVVQEKFDELTKNYDTLNAKFQKFYKDSGGR